MNYISNNSGEGSSVKSDKNLAEDASEYANQSRSSNHENIGKQFSELDEDNKAHTNQKKLIEEKVKEMHSSSSIYDEEVRAYNRTDPRQEEEFNREEYLFEFYVDSYSDDKIKEIISIFRNDFKPPKNLWIENMNIQANSDANYFNDVFADDDNYNDTEENPNDPATHNQEIDDIGYNISEIEKLKISNKPVKSKSDKISTEEQKSKPKEKEPSQPQVPKDSEILYNDRIKPKDESSDDEIEHKLEEPEVPKPKPEKKIEKSKIDNSTEQDAKELKISKAKDGLNIEVNDSGISDIGRNTSKHKQNNSGKGPSKRAHKSSKNDPKAKGDDFNQTRKLPTNILKDYEIENVDALEDLDDDLLHHDEPTRNKLTKEAEEQINKQLQMIDDEKARNDFDKGLKRKTNEKKSSRSKNRQNVAQKSSREGYQQTNKKKRPHSHKKRGSASTMQELKKKMGWANSHTSRGRTGDKFLNYSLDEINQKLQHNYNTNTSTNQKGIKKRLNKSFENVFSACASTSRARNSMRKQKKQKKKPISSSPRRMSIRDKKGSSSGQAKTPNTTSRKRLNGSLFNTKTTGNNNKTQYNTKELADRLCLINFSSMPSTPTGTTFIKKLGEKMNIMKAEKEKMIYNLCKKQLSLTSPNMGAILRAIVPSDKKIKNLKLKANDTSYLNSSGILSSRNEKEDRIINSSRQNEYFSFGNGTEGKLKRSHKSKNKDPLTERQKA